MTEFPSEVNSAARSLVESAMGDHQVEGILSRNQWLEAALNDPGRPLPAVALKPRNSQRMVVDFPDSRVRPRHTPPDIETDSFVVSAGEDRQDIGYVVINKPVDSAQKYFIADIKIVNEEYRGKGYGLATYLEVLKSLPAGRGLRTKGVLSEDAQRMWEKLVEKGVARQLHADLPPAEFETAF